MALALIAGMGRLPPHLVSAMAARGETPILCEMDGFASEVAPSFPRLAFRLETFGTLLSMLRDAGATQVCMAGAMRRPVIDSAAIDAATAPLVPRLMAALARGDDGTLREFVALFEEYGMEVVGAHQIAPDLLPAAGVRTRAQPASDLASAKQAARTALAEMADADLGQALIVRGGAVVAREDDRGTDAMLADLSSPRKDADAGDPVGWAMESVGDLLGEAADWLSGPGARAPAASAPILFKAPKPGQERRVDLPAIGPETARGAVDAGLAGIVIEEGGVMVLDQAQLIEILDRHGLFLEVASL